MILRLFRFLFLPGTLMLVCAFATSCGNADAKLRFVQASPKAAMVDVFVNGNSFATGVDYATATPYTNVPSGSPRVEVRLSGQSNDLISVNVNLSPDKPYTILTENLLASIAAVLLNDDLSTPPQGQARVRMAQASPSAGGVDLYVVAPGTDITTVNPTVTNLPFESATGYQTVAAGDYELVITPTGSKTVLFDSGTITLKSGQVRTAVALDTEGGGLPLTGIVLNDLN